MKKFTKKIFVLILALSVAMMPVAAGAATKSSTSKSTKTTTTDTTNSKTQTNTTKKADTTKNTEEEKTESKVETETEKKSEDTEKKTDEKVEETVEEETYPQTTYEVSSLAVELDQYFVFATGKAIEPTITSVSGKVTETTTTKVEVVVQKTESKTEDKNEDKADEKSESKAEAKSDSTEKADEKTDVKTDEKAEDKTETKTELKKESKSYEKTFTKDEYKVTYYKIVNGKYKKVDQIKDIGEYAVRVTLSEPYEETVDVLFSVIGIPQTLKVSNTEFTMHLGDSIELSPSATGDGSGFSYYVSRKGIVDIDKGIVRAEKPGWVEVTVKTTGNKLYQPATVKVEIEVVPDQVTWSKIKTGKTSTALSWEKQSVTGYDLRYCTEKAFKKPAKTAKDYKSRMKAYKYKKYTLKGTKKTLKLTSDTSTDKAETKSTKASNTSKDTKTTTMSGYVKVRAYVKTTDARGNVKYIYGAWSKAKKIG